MRGPWDRDEGIDSAKKDRKVIWLWINTYENTIFNGMNIHKSQLFWGEQKVPGF